MKTIILSPDKASNFWSVDRKRKAKITRSTFEKRIGYIHYLKSNQWKDLRRAVIKRDNFICVDCKENKMLDVHHLTYENFRHEKLEELVTLCRKCHDKRHGKK